MYTASSIAKWILLKNYQKRIENEQVEEYDVYEGITHLKLQKLLYYVQGIHLALYDCRLFSDPILAWTHGPVVQAVYDEYKAYGRSPIEYSMEDSDIDILNAIEQDEKAKTALELTYDNFSIYTAWQLRDMTHQPGSPWSKTMEGNPMNAIIDNDLIQAYFESEVVENGTD